MPVDSFCYSTHLLLYSTHRIDSYFLDWRLARHNGVRGVCVSVERASHLLSTFSAFSYWIVDIAEI